MTFRKVVWKNFKYEIRKYIAFFLCSSFTIAIFFIFANLTFSKEIQDFMKRAGMGAEYVFAIMVAILSIFSVIFISYINRSKNKSRTREFGLYMTMGMSYRDITRLIILEDTVIAGASIAVGMAVGMLFSRLFFMINIKIIDAQNSKYVLDYRSFLLTAVIFTAIYIVNIIITIFTRRRMNIRDLITADRESEYTGEAYHMLAAAGIVLMVIFAGISFAAALSRDIAMKRIPIILAIFAGMAGIYLVISNIVGIFAGVAKKNTNMYIKSLLSLSELKYTSKKNASVLFLLSLLSGMILLCSASTYALLNICEKIVDLQPQQVITYIEAMEVNKFDGALVEKQVRQSGAGFKEHLKYPCTFAFKTDNSENSSIPICIISSSTLIKMTENRTDLKEGEAKILAADPLMLPDESKSNELEITNGSSEYKFTLREPVINKNFRTEIVLGNRYILIVGDKTYQKLSETGKQLNGIIHEIRVENWRKSGPVFDRLNEFRDSCNALSQHFNITGNYTGYVLMKQLYSTFVFVTNFISILFFAATILILLFRQYESIDKMSKKYSQLRKLGMMRREFRKFIAAQTRFLFVVPLVFGLFMGTCLMLIIQSIMGGNDLYGEFWSASIKIAAIYIVFQLIFCRAVAEAYFKRIITTASVK